MGSHRPLSGWKEGLELTQDEIDAARQSVNRFDNGQPFGERYARSDLACVVDLWLGSRSGEQRPSHWRADFHYITGVGHGDRRFDVVPIKLVSEGLEANTGDWPELDLVRGLQDGRGDSVFVVIGEIAEHGQWVHIGTVPRGLGVVCASVVRLVRLNDVPVGGDDIGTDSSAVEPSGVVVHGELDSGGLRRHGPVTEDASCQKT